MQRFKKCLKLWRKLIFMKLNHINRPRRIDLADLQRKKVQEKSQNLDLLRSKFRGIWGLLESLLKSGPKTLKICINEVNQDIRKRMIERIDRHIRAVGARYQENMTLFRLNTKNHIDKKLKKSSSCPKQMKKCLLNQSRYSLLTHQIFLMDRKDIKPTISTLQSKLP